MSGTGDSRLRAYSVKRQIGKGSYGAVFLVTVQDGKKKVRFCVAMVTAEDRRQMLALGGCTCETDSFVFLQSHDLTLDCTGT